MKPIKEIFTELKQPRKVVITMHQKPDPDAMGSSLGLYLFLKQLGHDVTVISPTNWADFMNWMPGASKVLNYEIQTDACNEVIANADWFFCLDFNTLSRTRKMAEQLKKTHCIKLLIDHHQMPETEAFDYGVSDTSKSSTCEMLYDFICDAGYSDKINIEIAECIYAGVMTDTGSFRFPSTTASVHRLVAHLMDIGLKHSIIHENIFDNYLENRLRFFGHIFMNRMEVYYEYNTVLIYASRNDLQKYEIKTGDTEGLVNFPLSIKGIKLVALIFDRDEEIKLSFRSKGDFDVNVFARSYFNGGGHKNAAGGSSSDTLEKTIERFIAAIKENTHLLQ
jgi:phosphoesterase RecJ-like protein